MLRPAHLNLIARHSVRHGIRGGAGLVSLFLTLVIGLYLASIVLRPLEMVDRFGDSSDADTEMVAKVNRQVVSIAGKAINWVVEPTDEQFDYLTSEKPAMVSAILVLLFLATPFFACLAGFNQTSGDISTRGLRFLLIRTERANIFIGRFIGTYLFSALVNLALIAILSIYVAVKLKVHPPGDMVVWLLQGYLRIMVFSLPYIAVCAWVSCAIESAFGSLVIAWMLTYMFPLIIGQAANIESSLRYFQYATPWGYKYWLLQPGLSLQFLLGLVVMMAFTAVFLFFGMRYFAKRDL